MAHDEGMKALSAQFDQKLHDLYEQIVREVPGYRPTAFLAMLNELGGVETARRLNADVTDGFTRLWEEGRLDLAVEAAMIQVPSRRLFTRAELVAAQDRLDDALAHLPPSRRRR